MRKTIVSALLAAVTASAQVDYAKQVHPLLSARCAVCHTGATAQAGLDVNSRAELLKGGAAGPSIIPGDAAASLLIQRITGDKGPRMPLRGSALKNEEIQILKDWINQGAKSSGPAESTRWVAPLKPSKPAPPSTAAHPIDAFLNVKAAPVSDALFARRVYLDLWGLLPTPEQLEEFERDTTTDKRARLIDRLLADNGNYSAHWITFWNDLLRNDDGVTYYGERKSITRWLRNSLGTNLPYDRFVAELLSPKKKTGPEGFILGITWRGEVPASERPPLQAAQNSAQTFLGINLKCNSCHDSFISNWKLKDAYGLASFFTKTPLEIVRCDAKTGEISEPKFLFPELGAVKNNKSLEKRRAEAARMFTHPENGRLTRTLVNRYWKQLLGRAIVEPVDDMAAEPWNPALLDWLASDFAENGYDLKHLLRRMMTSEAYQLPTVAAPAKPGEKYVFRGPEPRRLTAEQFSDAVAAITGEWRPFPAPAARPTYNAREWQLKSSRLSRALGRPVRDQVTTERLTQPTTLQALELVNGPFLADWLHEGARRLAGEIAEAPGNLYDSGLVRRRPVKLEVDIRSASKLYLLIENIDSYDPSRVIPQWSEAVLSGKKKTPLAELLNGVDPEKLTLPSRIEIDLPPDTYKTFKAVASVDAKSLKSDINPAIRFFIFDREPDPRRLVTVAPSTPVARPTGPFTPETLVARVYRHALQRTPTAAEQSVAAEVLQHKLTADGVEDFLWMTLMSPEFQYIR